MTAETERKMNYDRASWINDEEWKYDSDEDNKMKGEYDHYLQAYPCFAVVSNEEEKDEYSGGSSYQPLYPAASASFAGADDVTKVDMLDQDFLDIYDTLAKEDDSYLLGPSPVAMPIVYAIPEEYVVPSNEQLQHVVAEHMDFHDDLGNDFRPHGQECEKLDGVGDGVNDSHLLQSRFELMMPDIKTTPFNVTMKQPPLPSHRLHMLPTDSNIMKIKHMTRVDAIRKWKIKKCQKQEQPSSLAFISTSSSSCFSSSSSSYPTPQMRAMEEKKGTLNTLQSPSPYFPLKP